jgi:hypothetical protein
MMKRIFGGVASPEAGIASNSDTSRPGTMTDSIVFMCANLDK